MLVPACQCIGRLGSWEMPNFNLEICSVLLVFVWFVSCSQVLRYQCAILLKVVGSSCGIATLWLIFVLVGHTALGYSIVIEEALRIILIKIHGWSVLSIFQRLGFIIVVAHYRPELSASTILAVIGLPVGWYNVIELLRCSGLWLLLSLSKGRVLVAINHHFLFGLIPVAAINLPKQVSIWRDTFGWWPSFIFLSLLLLAAKAIVYLSRIVWSFLVQNAFAFICLFLHVWVIALCGTA